MSTLKRASILDNSVLKPNCDVKKKISSKEIKHSNFDIFFKNF